MFDFLAQRLAWDIAFLLVGTLVLLPLLCWQGRKRWLKGWSEDKIQIVGLFTLVAMVALVAT